MGVWGKSFIGKRGLSLAEALAALVFVGIVVPAALRCICTSLRLGSESAKKAQALLLAEGKLSELVSTGAWQNTELSGDFRSTASGLPFLEEEGTDFRWIATVEDWLDSSLKQLTVTVYWESSRQIQELSVSTLVETEK